MVNRGNEIYHSSRCEWHRERWLFQTIDIVKRLGKVRSKNLNGKIFASNFSRYF